MSAARRKLLWCCLSLLVVTQLQALDRETWQPPDKIMQIVGIEPGMTIGEVGAGSGYFTIKIARLIGPQGRIYANDINADALSKLEEKRKNLNLNNIQIVHGKTADPNFPRVNLDLVIMVYVLHDMEQPERFLKTLKNYLMDDTPVAIVDRDPERFPGSSPWHFMKSSEILSVIESAGYTLEKLDSSLPRDNIYIIRR